MKNKTGNTLKLILVVLIFNVYAIQSQQLDFENIGRGRPFKISGNVAANTVFYNSNQNSARSPFTYFLQGSLNFSIYEFSIPVSYSFSNQGEDLEYQLPFNFNRLSLHPKYRWIQAHIGDVNMTFSPYTLAGHQFTGGGVELTPNGGFSFAAMYGRLLQATEDDEDNRTQPAFKRMGYGAKIGYQQDKYNVEVIGFYAKDEINSINTIPEDKNVLPKENLVLSMSGSLTVAEGLRLKGEYASTAITQDLRANETDNSQGIAGLFFNNRGSTEYYKAFKTELEYSFQKYRFGVGYERIDPGYQTLGAYFFNNDFENITLNGSTSIFRNKVSLSFNVGYQRDDLANQKETKTNRTVGSVNATYAVNKKLNISGSYSNFATFTNNRLDQFDNINDDNLLDNQDQLFDFRQLSQNANLNVGYIIESGKSRKQNLNANYSLATVANEENGIVRIGDGSTFHNFNTSYTIGLPQSKLNITSALNTTYNTIGREDSYTWGPTVAVNKKFLEDKLNTTFSTSYNQNSSKINKTKAANIRVNANYIYKKKHNFNLSAIQLFRINANQNTQDLTITFGYNYAFDLAAKKERRTSKNIKTDDFGFTHNGNVFSGEPNQITSEVLASSNVGRYKELYEVTYVTDKLDVAKQEMIDAELKSKRKYKRKASAYLEILDKYESLLSVYYDSSFKVLKKLHKNAERIAWSVEDKFNKAQVSYNNANIEEKKKTLKYLKKTESAFRSNQFMIDNLKNIAHNNLKDESGIFNEFKEKHLNMVFKMLDEGKTQRELTIFLELAYTKTYHDLAKKQAK